MDMASPRPQVWRYGRGRAVATGVMAAILAALAVVAPLGVAAGVVGLLADPPDDYLLGIAVLLVGGGAIAGLLLVGAAAVVKAARIAWRLVIALDGAELRLVVIAWSYNPFSPVRRLVVPLRDLRAVEIRDEATRAFGVTTIARTLSVLTATGERIVLGMTSPREVSGLPIETIGERIAHAAGLTLHDRGLVAAPPFREVLFKGRAASWDAPALAADDARLTRSRAAVALQIASGLVLLSVLLRACGHL